MKKILIYLFLSILSFSYQIDVNFPNPKMDDSVLPNTMFQFKGFKDQGHVYIEYKDLKKVNIYINSKKLDTKRMQGSGKIIYDISRFTKDDINTFEISNLVGSLNIKIDYPKVIEKSAGKYNKETIKFIEELIQSEINAGFPSAQIAVVKNAKLEYLKSFGYINNYNLDGTVKENREKVTDNTLYDLASNTKMYAVNLAIMKLVYEKKIDLDKYINEYFEKIPEDKALIQVRDLLQHQAGFPADPKYFDELYDMVDGIKNNKNDLYAIGKENVLEAIKKTPLIYEPKKNTKYSDVDYMLLGILIEQVTGMNLDDYVKENIYKPLNISHTTFNPLDNGFSKKDVAATEINGNTRQNKINFKNIRTDTIQGQVHDEKAFYSMNGVSGHAGLFSNAKDLSKLMQILINQGGYGKIKFFDKITLHNFIKPKDTNPSYGLGWRRQSDNMYGWAFSNLVSSQTIGHTGWTGTLTIIDPINNISIALLTNAKNTPIVNEKFLGDNFYIKNYGAISSLLMDAFINLDEKSTKERMDEFLLDLITSRYNYILNNKKYQNIANYNELLELIKLMKKRNKNLYKEVEQIELEMKRATI